MPLVERPHKLSEMVGQHATRREMINRSKEKDYPSGILLEGDSGSGKTTLSFIVAATLNCHNPQPNDEGGVDPCGQCPACKDTFEEKFSRDVHFIDGSTAGKEGIKELESIATSMPFYDKSKVIIIDEAQELSKQSFGVALHLLEKKRPTNVDTHFILCTMDRNAIDKPIKDRCRTFKFWPVPSNVIAEYLFTTLENTLSEEELNEIPEEFFKDGIFALADYAAGSVRAGISALERCVYGSLWESEEIQKELGYISPDSITRMIGYLIRGDTTLFTQLKRSQDAISDFFFKSWTALLDTKLYLEGALPAESLPDWKKRAAAEFRPYMDSVDKLLSVYAHIYENSRYIKPDYFITQLWKGFYEVPKMSRQKPVRPVRKAKGSE